MSSFTWADESQDIVIKTRLDRQSSASFMKRIRNFLINNHLGDPYNQTLKAPIIIDLNQVVDLPIDTQSWVRDLQAMLNLNFFESKYKLKIEELGYKIQDYTSELHPVQSGLNRVEYVTTNFVKGVSVFSSKISFQVELQRTQNGTPIKFFIDLVEPEFVMDPELVLELPMGWQSSVLPHSLMLALHTIDLSKIFNKIAQKPELITFSLKDINIPDISINVGSRTVRFDKEKIKNFLYSRQDEMKMAIIDLMKTRMNDRFDNVLRDHPLEIFPPRVFSTSSEISAVFNVRTMDAEKESKIVEARVDGHFCTDKAAIPCRENQLPTKVRREILPDSFEQSMSEINLLFTQKRANIAVSVSEHYLNQLISAAAQAGSIDLGGQDFTLGSEKAFVLAEEKGEGFSLYLDILYKLTGPRRISVGTSLLHFPIKLSIGLKIVNIDGFPTFQIKVLDIKTSSSLLLHGMPEYGLKSNVGSVRFQNNVIKQIKEDIRPFNKKVLVNLELKEFKDTYLEELNFLSDGRGRATAILFMTGEK